MKSSSNHKFPTTLVEVMSDSTSFAKRFRADKSTLEKMADAAKTNTSLLKALTDSTQTEKCVAIRKSVLQGIAGNVEINFSKKTQKFEGQSYPLSDTLLKVRGGKSDNPVRFFVGSQDKLDAIVFAGEDGESAQAFVATKGENGDNVSEIEEFYALSMSEKSSSDSEVGLLTSFNKSRGKVYSCFIEGAPTLDAVKSLINDTNDNSEKSSGISKLSECSEAEETL